MQVFCLIPAGDSIVTDRLYTAVAAGCLPVVLAIVKPGAYKEAVNYSAFWHTPSNRAFVRDPNALVAELRAMPAQEVARRQRAMHAARADLLFNVANSRAADNFLRIVAGMRCFGGIKPHTHTVT